MFFFASPRARRHLIFLPWRLTLTTLITIHYDTIPLITSSPSWAILLLPSLYWKPWFLMLSWNASQLHHISRYSLPSFYSLDTILYHCVFHHISELYFPNLKSYSDVILNGKPVSEEVAYTIGDAAGKAEYNIVKEAVVNVTVKGFKWIGSCCKCRGKRRKYLICMMEL